MSHGRRRRWPLAAELAGLAAIAALAAVVIALASTGNGGQSGSHTAVNSTAPLVTPISR